jgi:HlyD family secretion protein
MMKKTFRWICIIGLMGVLVLGAGCKRQVKKNTVAVVPVTKEKMTVEAFGIVKAKEEVGIYIDFPVKVEQVPVKNGQKVSFGEPLVSLNIKDFEAQIKNKENELSTARFELLKEQKNLKDAQDSYAQAQQELSAKETLLKEGAISQHEVDEYRDTVKAKEKAVTDVLLSPGTQNKELTSIRIREGKVALLESDLKRLQGRLNQSFLKGNIIVSPLRNGVVSEIGCVAGDLLGLDNYNKKVLSVLNLDGIYIQADVAEEFIKDVKIGAKVTFIPIANNSQKYEGRVMKISNLAVKQNGETIVPVEISILKPDGFLRPNFNVDVTIER